MTDGRLRERRPRIMECKVDKGFSRDGNERETARVSEGEQGKRKTKSNGI